MYFCALIRTEVREENHKIKSIEKYKKVNKIKNYWKTRNKKIKNQGKRKRKTKNARRKILRGVNEKTVSCKFFFKFNALGLKKEMGEKTFEISKSVL